jgi:hypothetical protein
MEESEEGEIENPPLPSDKEISFSDYLDKMCAYYMSIGVPYDLYWWGDYTMLKYFHEANKQRTENENYMMWVQGMYFNSALSSALSAFGKKKIKYLSKPIKITEKTNEEIAADREAVLKSFVASLDLQAIRDGKPTLAEVELERKMDEEL